MANPLHGDSDQADIAGVSGVSVVSDGVRGDTQSNSNNGVVGGNESTASVPEGKPGGNGVFGFSNNPTGSGVFGVNNATSQVNSPGGGGVFGFASAPGAAGVFGASNRADRGRGCKATVRFGGPGDEPEPHPASQSRVSWRGAALLGGHWPGVLERAGQFAPLGVTAPPLHPASARGSPPHVVAGRIWPLSVKPCGGNLQDPFRRRGFSAHVPEPLRQAYRPWTCAPAAVASAGRRAAQKTVVEERRSLTTCPNRSIGSPP